MGATRVAVVMRAALAVAALAVACSEYGLGCPTEPPPTDPAEALRGRPCEDSVCIAAVTPGNNEAVDVPRGCREDPWTPCEDYLVLENRTGEPVDLSEYDLERDDNAHALDELRDLGASRSLGHGECVALVASAEPSVSPNLAFDLGREFGTLRLLRNLARGGICEVDVVYYGFPTDAGWEPCDEGLGDVDGDGSVADLDGDGTFGDACAVSVERDFADGSWHRRLVVSDPAEVGQEPCRVAADP